MKCNAILETSIAVAAEGDMSKWPGATLLNGGYNDISSKLYYQNNYACLSLSLSALTEPNSGLNARVEMSATVQNAGTGVMQAL
jgi:hypothetical protein